VNEKIKLWTIDIGEIKEELENVRLQMAGLPFVEDAWQELEDANNSIESAIMELEYILQRNQP